MVYTHSDLEIALTTDPDDSTKGTLDLRTRENQSSGGYGVKVSLIEEPLNQLYAGVLKIIYLGTYHLRGGTPQKPMPASMKINFEITQQDTGKIIGDDHPSSFSFKVNSTYLLEVINGTEDSFQRDVYNLVVTDDEIRLETAVTLA